MSGRVFGRLTVVGKSDRRAKNGDVYWECECQCGKKQIYHTRSNLIKVNGGKIVSCGCYRKDGNCVVNKEIDREKHIIKYLYGKLKVRNRKLGFNNDNIIELASFSEMIKKPCNYCGLVDGNTSYDTENWKYEGGKKDIKGRVSDYVLKHNGIDRVDSSQGYINSNSVTCCKFCNMAKSNMPIDEFLE